MYIRRQQFQKAGGESLFLWGTGQTGEEYFAESTLSRILVF